MQNAVNAKPLIKENPRRSLIYKGFLGAPRGIRTHDLLIRREFIRSGAERVFTRVSRRYGKRLHTDLHTKRRV